MNQIKKSITVEDAIAAIKKDVCLLLSDCGADAKARDTLDHLKGWVDQLEELVEIKTGNNLKEKESFDQLQIISLTTSLVSMIKRRFGAEIADDPQKVALVLRKATKIIEG